MKFCQITRATVSALIATHAMTAPSFAQDFTYPAEFRNEQIETNGATIYVRIGGDGPAVVLLHGYGETGDMWAPMAEDLARDLRSSCLTCADWALVETRRRIRQEDAGR